MKRLLYWSLLAIVIGSFCFILAYMPYAMDDLDFLAQIEREGFAETVKWHFFRDNARLANLFCYPLFFIPKWVTSVVQCVSFSIGVLLMTKVTCVEGSFKKLSLLLALFVFAPVWDDNMFTTLYSFGYIVGVFPFFGAMWIYQNSERLPWWFIIPAGVIAGVWHESFSLILLVGWGIIGVFDRKSLTTNRIWLIGAVGVGLMWLLVNPGVWMRQSRYHFSVQHSYRLIFYWLYFAYVALWAICFANAKTRHLAKRPLSLFALGGFILIPFTIMTGIERSLMPGIMASCCSTTCLVAALCRHYGRPGRIGSTVIAAFLAIITSVHLFAVDYETTIVVPIYKDICETFKNAPPEQRHIFMPVRYNWDAPAITLRRPINDFLNPNECNMRTTQLWAGKKWWATAVPPELKEFRKGLGTPISDDSTIVNYKGHIVATTFEDTLGWRGVTTYRWSPKPEFAKTWRVTFPGADGNKYVYIIPSRSILGRYMGEPIKFENP